MRPLLGVVVLLGLIAVLADVVEAKWVLAPLLGLAIWAWARATLRSFTSGGTTGTSASDAPEVVADADERTLYWCEECGTEVVLVVRGSGTPPRHCGTRMHERAELLR